MTTKTTIGELIEKEVRRQQIPITEFAKMICCKRNNVYDIFNRNKMDIVQLKQISKVLNRNFFKELSEDVELINDDEESEEDAIKQKAVSQFFNIVPDVLCKLGKPSTIVFSRLDEPEYKDCPTPDFGLPDDFITFTIGETLKERIGNCSVLPIASVSNEDGFTVEVCTNIICGSVCVNIKLDYKTSDEWYKILAFAFETYAKAKKQ
ncbi:hypothetical protein [uncultured Muribaculum sp.]|uniref:hypothetical protein n=1 Tax=uncultured Muribaculum sp. TaxID=1918613 RepID=UPI0025B6DDD5|nr:hypothetical protein [uncultured Muribaculum sp.]